MNRYAWSGLSLDGNRISGKSFASNHKTLRDDLLRQGVALLSFKVKNNKPESKHFFLFVKKISNKDKSLFFEQLSTLVLNGLTLLDSLDLVKKQIKNKTVNEIILDSINNIKRGGSLSLSFSNHKKLFTETEISIIDAGENSGKLGFSLSKISGDLNRKIKLQKKLQNAAMLPIVTLLFSLFLVLGIFLFVLPQFENLFFSFDKELPIVTKKILLISRFLRSDSMFSVSILFILSLLLFKFILKFEFVKKFKYWVILKIYFIKDIFIYHEIINFFQTLSMFLSSGVDLKKSLDLSKNTINNFFIKEQFIMAIDFVIKGATLEYSLRKCCYDILPENVIAFVGIGEKTGKLSDMLERSAHVCQNELDQKLKIITTFIQPGLLVVVGIIVVVLMISIYLPIFSMAGLA